MTAPETVRTVSAKLENHSEYETGALVIYFYANHALAANLTINHWRGDELFLASSLDWTEHGKLPAAAILNYKPTNQPDNQTTMTAPEKNKVRRLVIEHRITAENGERFPPLIIDAEQFGEDFDKYNGETHAHTDGLREGIPVYFHQTFITTDKTDAELIKDFNHA